jgi:hypothetical protein
VAALAARGRLPTLPGHLARATPRTATARSADDLEFFRYQSLRAKLCGLAARRSTSPSAGDTYFFRCTRDRMWPPRKGQHSTAGSTGRHPEMNPFGSGSSRCPQKRGWRSARTSHKSSGAGRSASRSSTGSRGLGRGPDELERQHLLRAVLLRWQDDCAPSRLPEEEPEDTEGRPGPRAASDERHRLAKTRVMPLPSIRLEVTTARR